MSIKFTPPTLASICSTPSDLSAKLHSMSVHQSVQELEFYRILSRLIPISYTRGVYTWGMGGGCSWMFVECTPPTLVSICSSPPNLSAKHYSMSVDRFVQELVHTQQAIAHIIHQRLTWWAVIGCPSNVHPQRWCLSAPLHQTCLLNFNP